MKKKLKTLPFYKQIYLIRKYFECIQMYLKPPKYIDVELSSLCNFRCLKCPTYEGSRPRGFMEGKIFYKLLEDLQKTDWKIVLNLTGSGEVILHPEIVDFIKAAKQIQQIKTIQIGTNAYALNPQLAKELINAGVDRFKISLDTDDKKEFFTINRVDGLDEVESNINWICNYIRQNKKSTEVELKITCYKNQTEKTQRLINKWKLIVHSFRATNLHNWGGLRGQNNLTRKSPCRILFHMIQIRWDGSFTLCCCDVMSPTYNYGNVMKTDLASYWNHNKSLKKAKANHLMQKFKTLELCKTCTLDDPSYETFFSGSRPQIIKGV